MRNARDRSVKTGRAHFVHHELAVDDRAAGGFEHAPGHPHAFVIRPHFERAHAAGDRPGFGAALVFAFAQVGVPIVAPDGEVGNQVMQVRFVHHHHAGMPQRGFVNETVMRVVAQVIQRDVKAGWIERPVAIREDFQIHQGLQMFDQGFGIIGDPAAAGRQRREKRHAHSAHKLHRQRADGERRLDDQGRAGGVAIEEDLQLRSRTRAPSDGE